MQSENTNPPPTLYHPSLEETGRRLRPGRHILITGAAGFLGSHLVEGAVRRGLQARAFLPFHSRHDIGMLQWLAGGVREAVEIVWGDIADPMAVQSAMEGVEDVFHVAGSHYDPLASHLRLQAVRACVDGTANILEAARRGGAQRVTLISSSSVYGAPRYTPVDEDHPLQALTPMAAALIGADQLALSYLSAHGLATSVLRPVNIYGPRQRNDALIPSLIAGALSGGPVRIMNPETPLDLAHVTDFVSAVFACADSEAAVGEVFNIGCGESITLGELARQIVSRIDARVPIEIEPYSNDHGAQSLPAVIDRAKAESVLGWRPAVGLDEGLDQTIEWRRGAWNIRALENKS